MNERGNVHMIIIIGFLTTVCICFWEPDQDLYLEIHSKFLSILCMFKRQTTRGTAIL